MGRSGDVRHVRLAGGFLPGGLRRDVTAKVLDEAISGPVRVLGDQCGVVRVPRGPIVKGSTYETGLCVPVTWGVLPTDSRVVYAGGSFFLFVLRLSSGVGGHPRAGLAIWVATPAVYSRALWPLVQ